MLAEPEVTAQKEGGERSWQVASVCLVTILKEARCSLITDLLTK